VIDPTFRSAGDRVLVLGRVRARGPASEVEIEFTSGDEALKAVARQQHADSSTGD
jgi:hypothetical protein